MTLFHVERPVREVRMSCEAPGFDVVRCDFGVSIQLLLVLHHYAALKHRISGLAPCHPCVLAMMMKGY